MMKFKDLSVNFSACGFLFQQNNSMWLDIGITRPIFSHFDEQAWSYKDLSYGQKENFFMRDRRKKTRANKMGSLARNSSILNHTNAASDLPIEHFSYLFFIVVLVNKNDY